MAEWLRRAIAYEIYPQSFADSDADGVGDLIWLNPCFASPMRDGGEVAAGGFGYGVFTL